MHTINFKISLWQRDFARLFFYSIRLIRQNIIHFHENVPVCIRVPQARLAKVNESILTRGCMEAVILFLRTVRMVLIHSSPNSVWLTKCAPHPSENEATSWTMNLLYMEITDIFYEQTAGKSRQQNFSYTGISRYDIDFDEEVSNRKTCFFKKSASI